MATVTLRKSITVTPNWKDVASVLPILATTAFTLRNKSGHFLDVIKGGTVPQASDSGIAIPPFGQEACEADHIWVRTQGRQSAVVGFEILNTAIPTIYGPLAMVGSLTMGVAANGVTITGATPNSTIALNIAGLTVTGAGTTRTVTGIPAASGFLVASETLAGATESYGSALLGTVTAAAAPIGLTSAIDGSPLLSAINGQPLTSALAA